MAVRVRDEFLALAAHELKTPITSLRGVAQLAVRRLDRVGALRPEQLRTALQTIDAQSAKLATLVSQLLEVARDEAGRFAIDRSREDVVAIVRGAVETARAQAPDHQMLLSAPPQAIAWVDPLRLEQVIVNLLDNALKFSPHGGAIEVEVAVADAMRIAVRDHGIGVPPEHRSRLFERFYQAHARDYRSGLGLGLYICRRIVELHGGTIAAEFPPDGGTRMVVTLPPAPADLRG